LKMEPEAVDLPDQERCVIDFALKLSREPGDMSESDVDELRNLDFDDRGILEIVMLTGLYELMNRLADGLGVLPGNS